MHLAHFVDDVDARAAVAAQVVLKSKDMSPSAIPIHLAGAEVIKKSTDEALMLADEFDRIVTKLGVKL